MKKILMLAFLLSPMAMFGSENEDLPEVITINPVRRIPRKILRKEGLVSPYARYAELEISTPENTTYKIYASSKDIETLRETHGAENVKVIALYD
ncbi:MAG: hypothetical protein WD055_06430 [Candidatus Dependentiae bacterium]